LGIGLCLASGLTYALYALMNKKLVQHASPAITTLGVFMVGALLALPAAALWAGPLQITASGWLVVGFLGIASTGVAYLLFTTGLRSISAASGVSLALMEPVTAFLLALVVVGERPGALAYAGLAALLAGRAIVIRAETPRHLRPPPVRATSHRASTRASRFPGTLLEPTPTFPAKPPECDLRPGEPGRAGEISLESPIRP